MSHPESLVKKCYLQIGRVEECVQKSLGAGDQQSSSYAFRSFRFGGLTLRVVGSAMVTENFVSTLLFKHNNTRRDKSVILTAIIVTPTDHGAIWLVGENLPISSTLRLFYDGRLIRNFVQSTFLTNNHRISNHSSCPLSARSAGRGLNTQPG